MFKISHFEKRDGKQYIEIQCQFVKNEILTHSKHCDSGADAMRFFNFIATEFLQGQVGEFTKIILHIKPYYFDKNSTPYMSMGNAWRDAYWKFTYGLIPILSELYWQPGAYADKILKNEFLFEALIPSMTEIGKVEMNFIKQDIIKCAKSITETLHRMKTNDLKQLLNKTA